MEGLKTIPLPRICVQRNELSPSYFDVSDTIATDGSIEIDKIDKSMEILDLNNIRQIIQWIDKNAKVL